MATKTPPPQFKAVVRSKRGTRMEFSGDLYTGMIQSFFYTDGKEQRESILNELQKIHQELSELEFKARPA